MKYYNITPLQKAHGKVKYYNITSLQKAHGKVKYYNITSLQKNYAKIKYYNITSPLKAKFLLHFFKCKKKGTKITSFFFFFLIDIYLDVVFPIVAIFSLLCLLLLHYVLKGKTQGKKQQMDDNSINE